MVSVYGDNSVNSENMTTKSLDCYINLIDEEMIEYKMIYLQSDLLHIKSKCQQVPQYVRKMLISQLFPQTLFLLVPENFPTLH